MPPKLNLKQQVTIEPGFMDLLKEIWKERWKALNDEILQAAPGYRDFTAQKNAPAMSRLQAACTVKASYDYELTQLLCLPFVKFWIENHAGAIYLAGLTQPIVLTDLGPRRWQGPRYTIYVPRDAFPGGSSARFHFVPEGRELSYARHPHHHANTGSSTHPLDMYPSTCWGSFGTMVNACCRAGDVTNLFRTLYIYLTRVDFKSLYTTFEDCVQFKPLKTASGQLSTPPQRRRR